MKYKIALSIKDYGTINVYTGYESLKTKLESEQSHIRRTIPITSAVVTDMKNDCVEVKDSIIVVPRDKKSMIYNPSLNCATLYVNEDELRFPDLVYVCLTMFTKALARNNKYLLHSSALVNENGDGVILVGEANAGKTTLAYELMQNNGFKLISNDHSIIGIENGKPYILGGTKDVQMRLGSLLQINPELGKQYVEKDTNVWEKKVVINGLVELPNILYPNDDKCIIKDIYSISTMSDGEGFIKPKERVDEFLFIYGSLTRVIKGINYCIYGFGYPMPSIETPEMLNNIKDICNLMADECQVYDAKGSTRYLSREIKRNAYKK